MPTIAEILQRYPKGIIYRSLYNDKIVESTGEVYTTQDIINKHGTAHMTQSLNDFYHIVYTNNKWAEIISTPGLPEKWCIKVIGDYEANKEVYSWRGSKWYDLGYLHSNKDWYSSIMPGYTEITFNQFKQYILKDQMKKIIGYKLIKPEFAEACKSICKTYADNSYSIGIDFTENSANHNKLKSAGVLDLWFTPVYEEQKVTMKVGSLKVELMPTGFKTSEGNFSIRDAKSLLPFAGGSIQFTDRTVQVSGDLKYTIGCKTFKLSELRACVEKWESLYGN